MFFAEDRKAKISVMISSLISRRTSFGALEEISLDFGW